MALVLGELFVSFWSRQLLAPLSGAGTVARPWNAVAIGVESGPIPFAQPDDDGAIFQIQPIAPPAPFTPLGDLCTFRGDDRAAIQGTPIAQSPLTIGPDLKIITQMWVEFPSAPGIPFAICQFRQEMGITRLFLALGPNTITGFTELVLDRKNPAFP